MFKKIFNTYVDLVVEVISNYMGLQRRYFSILILYERITCTAHRVTY
jgi:hypothetical protein